MPLMRGKLQRWVFRLPENGWTAIRLHIKACLLADFKQKYVIYGKKQTLHNSGQDRQASSPGRCLNILFLHHYASVGRNQKAL